jgi:glycosyltransferase involved in cell wall biosynthesis
MNKLKVGIVINSKMVVGGGFSYAQTLVDSFVFKKSKYDFVFYSTEVSTVKYLQNKGLNSKLIYSGFRKLLSGVIRQKKLSIGQKIEKLIKQDRVDLIYLVGPLDTWVNLKNMNFIITIHDLGHRDIPQFPEVYKNNEFDRRERVYGGGVKKALAVVVDSKITKNKLVKYYGIEKSKIVIVPFITKKRDVNIKLDKAYLQLKYQINKNYIYYPAQFWAHKNHKYILDGILELEKSYNVIIDIVFSGSDYGTQNYIQQLASKMGLSNRLHILGFISDEDVTALYVNSLALVMPTCLGPTNIPPLEAFKLKVPVVYSKQDDMDDILKVGCNLVDLSDPRELAETIIKVMHNDISVTNRVEIAHDCIVKREMEFSLKSIFDIFDKYASSKAMWIQ